MEQSLGEVTLKSGEAVQCSVVTGPCEDWQQRISKLLGHKGGLWNQHISRSLMEQLKLDTRFYLLHRDGEPFANIMTVENHGSGIFGHVYTLPEDRRKSAASRLMDKLMGHVKARDCQALFLGTGYDTPPYHIYKRYGFEGLEPGSGYMTWYAESEEIFNAQWFAKGPTEVQTIGWQHWGSSPALTMGGWPGLARISGSSINRRTSTEYGLLPIIAENEQHEANDKPACGKAMVQSQTGAVVGLATQQCDRMWPQTRIVDVYCHPNFWDDGKKLLDSLTLPDDQKLLAYCDETCSQRRELFEAAGFRVIATLPKLACTDALCSDRVDVQVMERQ